MSAHRLLTDATGTYKIEIMILEKLEQNWDRIERIGAEAEKRGREIGMRPSWTCSTAPSSTDMVNTELPAKPVRGSRAKFSSR